MERPKSLKATTKKLVEQAEMVCLANATSFMQMLILIYQGIKKFNNSDFLNYNIQIIFIARHFINDIKEEKFREYKEQMLLKMQRFLKASGCRRNILLKHFEEEDAFKSNDSKDDCDSCSGPDCCDNCDMILNNRKNANYEKQEAKDYTNPAFKLLSAIKLLNEKFGISFVIGFLLGVVSE